MEIEYLPALREGQERYKVGKDVYSIVDLRVAPDPVLLGEAMTRAFFEQMSAVYPTHPIEVLFPDEEIERFETWTEARQAMKRHIMNKEK